MLRTDWVKIDNCNYGTVAELVANQRAISLALQATKRPMVIQMGAFVLPSLWNPHAQPRADYTNRYDLAPWVWGPNVSNMWYTGPDKGNSWDSTLRNIMINAQGRYAQKPGAYNFAGDLWCGTPQSNVPGEYMPPMSAEEERSTYAMWVIMAAPLMLGCDIRNLTTNARHYLTNEELLSVNQDAWVSAEAVWPALASFGDWVVFVHRVCKGRWSTSAAAAGRSTPNL